MRKPTHMQNIKK